MKELDILYRINLDRPVGSGRPSGMVPDFSLAAVKNEWAFESFKTLKIIDKAVSVIYRCFTCTCNLFRRENLYLRSPEDFMFAAAGVTNMFIALIPEIYFTRYNSCPIPKRKGFSWRNLKDAG